MHRFDNFEQFRYAVSFPQSFPPPECNQDEYAIVIDKEFQEWQ